MDIFIGEGMKASEARRLSDKSNMQDLYEILDSIKIQAEKGETKLHMYRSFSKWENELKNLGYDVSFSSSIAIQKDSHYGTISW